MKKKKSKRLTDLEKLLIRRTRRAREELLHLFILRKPGRTTLTYRCIKNALLILGPHKDLPKSWFGSDKTPKREAPTH